MSCVTKVEHVVKVGLPGRSKLPREQSDDVSKEIGGAMGREVELESLARAKGRVGIGAC